MEKKKDTKFKKGQSGNPAGRAKLPDDIRAARNLSYNDMCRTVIEVRAMIVPDKQEEKKELRKMTLGKKVIYGAYLKGDANAIKIYEDRLWGKAKESIDLNPEGNLNINITMNNAGNGYKS